MKKLMAIVAVAVVVAFTGASLVEAGQCPTLIKQLKDGIGKVSDSKKKADIEKMIDETQKLHDAGKHADAIKKAQEAAKVAGIELKMK